VSRATSLTGNVRTTGTRGSCVVNKAQDMHCAGDKGDRVDRTGLTGHALPSWPIVFWYVPSVGLYSTATTPCRALGVRLPSKARSVLPSWDNENRHRKLGAIRRMDQVDRRKLTLTATTPGT
jgi:hypothetical protein